MGTAAGAVRFGGGEAYFERIAAVRGHGVSGCFRRNRAICTRAKVSGLFKYSGKGLGGSKTGRFGNISDGDICRTQ